MFIRDLVWNLFGEGNDVFREGDWTKSIEMYTEALSVAEYGDSEEIYVPTNLLEKLYANRAAAYLNIVPVSRREWSHLLSFCAKRAAIEVDFRACIEHPVIRFPVMLIRDLPETMRRVSVHQWFRLFDSACILVIVHAYFASHGPPPALTPLMLFAQNKTRRTVW